MADMALLRAPSTRSGAELARIGLSEYFDDELFRPSLADELKVGFFSLDRACQTTQSDVIDLKDMTVVLKTLLLDVSDMKRDIHLAKEKVKTDYDTKIQYRALDLCKRVSDQMAEIEDMHKERVMVVRRAFRQQFADALARIGTLFQARFEQSMEKEKLQLKQEIQRLRGQMQQMTLTIQKNESIIIMLKNQLASKPAPSERSRKAVEPPAAEDKRETRNRYTMTSPLPPRSQRDASPPPPSQPSRGSDGALAEREPTVDPARLAQLVKEVESLKVAMQAKEKTIGSMEDELDERQRQFDELSEQHSKLQTDFEKQEAVRLQLAQELDESRGEASRQAAAASKLAAMAGELEQQRLELERAAEEKIRKARDEAEGAGSERLREVQAEFGARIRQLMKDNEDLEKQLVRERAKNLATPPKKVEEELTDTEKLIKSEAMWRQLVDKYKKEIERNNAAWEKRFLVMQASLHALKDESYLRHTLEKQHAALHHATISYTAEGPMTVSAAPTRRSVLPGIASIRAASPDPLASYVVSVAPSRLSQQAPENSAAGEGSEAVTPRMTVLASATSVRSAMADRRERDKPARASSKGRSLSAVGATPPPVVIDTQ